MNKPFVYLIGAGPGDPGLITVRGRDCLKRSDVVLYDYLANHQLLEAAPPHAELIYAGKVGGAHNREQGQINDLIVAKAREGKVVARLKGGDPFVFGRGGEECEALVDAGIPFEIVPGVTAGIGAATYAGIPLTHRDVTTSVAFVTGHEHPDKATSEIDWEKLSLGSGTVVFYMGVRNLPQITTNLMAHGRSPQTPVALIRWGTRPEQEVLTGTLADIAEKAKKVAFKPPAITIVGEVVRLRETLRWFDNRPLSGKGILVTRSVDQAGEFAATLREKGANVYECPTISIVPPDDSTDLDAAITTLPSFDWLILTSVNAVNYFMQRLAAHGLDSRAIGRCKVAAVGPKTAEALRPYGIIPDLIPADYKAEGVIGSLSEQEIREKKILYPRADKARKAIEIELTALGAIVTAPVAYCNILPDGIPAEILEALEKKRIHCVTFTASSTVSNLAALVGENRLLHLLEGVIIAAIGPVTAATCRDLGLEVHIEPEKYTLEKMTEAIVHHFTS